MFVYVDILSIVLKMLKMLCCICCYHLLSILYFGWFVFFLQLFAWHLFSDITCALVKGEQNGRQDTYAT